jgi:hypothetical protein
VIVNHEELEKLRRWVANRAEHAARSDLNGEEERGWRLALGGVEYRLKRVFGEIETTGRP